MKLRYFLQWKQPPCIHVIAIYVQSRKKVMGQSKEHCVKCVQIQRFFWSVFSRIRTEHGPEKTPYLDTSHAVEIKQKSKVLKIFDICFSIIFSCYNQSLISGKETGNWALPPINFEIILIFRSLLRFYKS